MLRPIRALVFVSFLALWFIAGRAEPRQADPIEAKIDRLVGLAMQRNTIPGMELGLVVNGQPRFTRGYGVQSLATRVPPDTGTIQPIGSISKSFTAFGALMLVDEGKLNLDAPVGTYLRVCPNNWRMITPRQLMTHTSGLPDGVPRRDALESDLDEPLLFAPGTKQSYSNEGYALMGKVMEALSGQPYQAYMQRRVFGPLGLTSTGYYNDFLGRPDYARGYRLIDGQLAVAFPRLAVDQIPPGGIASNMNDMLAWDTAMRNGRLLSPGAYNAMWTRYTPPGDTHPWNFSCGWQVRGEGPNVVIAKNGMVAGYSAMYQMVPSQGVSLIMLWNRSGKDDLWPLADNILFECFGIPHTRPGERVGAPLPEGEEGP